MWIGSSRVRIIPPIGSPLAGYSNRSSFSTGIADDLHARTLVLDDGRTRIGIISCDLIGILPDFTGQAERRAAELGIPQGNLMISAFHTHSGPTPDFGYANMDRYVACLDESLASGLTQAASRWVEADFGHSSTMAPDLTVNRRDPTRGAVDPEIGVLSWLSGGTSVAQLVNYSCHAVVLGPDNTLISADYPGCLMKLVEDRTGSICLFTNGACGDINPLTGKAKAAMEGGEDIYDRAGGTFEEAEEMGTMLGTRILAALEGMSFGEADLACANHIIRIQGDTQVPPETIAARSSQLERELACLKAMAAEPDKLYGAGLGLALSRRSQEIVRRGFAQIRLQAIRIGPVVLVGIPGELFVEIGLGIKRKASSLGLKGFVVELANDYLGYLPTSSAFAKGGYEVGIARGLGLGKELENSILEGAGSMLEGME